MAQLPEFTAPDSGKMFGVLVVRDAAGAVGLLCAFSGMLDGRWDIEGFVPPVFNRVRRLAIEPSGEVCVKQMGETLHHLEHAPELVAKRASLVTLKQRHHEEDVALRAQHADNKRLRQAERAKRADAHALDQLSRGDKAERAKRPDAHELDQLSRGDKAERRRQDVRHEEELSAVQRPLRKLEQRVRAQARLRQMASRRLMQQLHDTYDVRNARGEHRPLRSLYAPGEPPSGAADCAAPKLLHAAYEAGLTPIALAEFWWGPPPRTGGRLHGNFYPACKTKCGPLLPFMLEGLDVTPHAAFARPESAALPLRFIHEDADLVVVEKPAGLLSVPAKEDEASDSVLTRLRAKYPHATGPLIVHRLDLDTSGLLVAALTADAYADLQRQFVEREVHKHYVAWIDGIITADSGVIELPLRVDLEDRPRQIHDPVHGLHAQTHWRVLERSGARTRVAFTPVTGRTHQLRVHAAHPLGLAAPIVGDRLYGRANMRLMLHAEALSFVHPRTGQRMAFQSPAPF